MTVCSCRVDLESAPVIISQPLDVLVNEGECASFQVVARGSDPLTYQWYKNDVAIDQATSSTYTVPATNAADHGAKFHVTVNNGIMPCPISNKATLSVSSGPLKPSVLLSGYQLVWNDEFDGASLDAKKWTNRTGPRRDAMNSDDAVSVANGMLTITTYTNAGVHYTAFLDTAGKYQPTYGFLEARIRFQPTPGEWGAFWIQTPTQGTPFGDPGAAGAEIDVVEHLAVNKNEVDISTKISSSVHWDQVVENGVTKVKTVTSGFVPITQGGAITGQWHVFALEWTSAGYTIYVDGIPTWNTTSGVSNRSEFIRITCEVEDFEWAGHIPAGGFGTLDSSTTKMDVDWVRVWQKK